MFVPLFVATMLSSQAQGLPPINPLCKLVTGRTLILLAAADSAYARKDIESANSLLDSALWTIGDAYFRNSEDDSGLHLQVAEI